MRKKPEPPEPGWIPRSGIRAYFRGGLSEQQTDKYVRLGILPECRIGKLKFYSKETIDRLVESGELKVLPSTDTPAKRRARRRR
jgi:hypothetical protein